MQDIDLSDLQAFATVARARGFRGAAQPGAASASALSEAVRRLEGRLGVRLLNRTTRSVTPTEAGERLLQRLGPALGAVAEALDALNSFRDSPTGTLRLNVPSAVGRLVMPAILRRFCARYPKISVDVSVDDSFIDVLAAGFDAGVRYDESIERDMIAVPIGPRRQRFATAASPAYLDAHGRPDHPQALMEHACIRHRFASGAIVPWEFECGDETLRINPPARVIATMVDLEVSAAVAGLGVIHLFDGLILPMVEAGLLEIILPDWAISFPGPFLYYPSRRHMPAPLRAFVDAIKEDPG